MGSLLGAEALDRSTSLFPYTSPSPHYTPLLPADTKTRKDCARKKHVWLAPTRNTGDTALYSKFASPPPTPPLSIPPVLHPSPPLALFSPSLPPALPPLAPSLPYLAPSLPLSLPLSLTLR